MNLRGIIAAAATSVAILIFSGCADHETRQPTQTVTKVVAVPTVITETTVVTETVDPEPAEDAYSAVDRLQDAYLADLRAQGYVVQAPDRAWLIASGICMDLSGSSILKQPLKTRAEIIDQRINSGSSRDAARIIVDTSIKHYCPDLG